MDELKRLFDALSSRGYYTKSFDEFKVKFQDPAYQEKVFGVVSRDGLYTKTKDEFFAKYVTPTQAPVIDKKKEGTASPLGVGSLASQTKLPKFIEEQTATITPELIGQNEETVVPQMQYQFGPMGFKFEETGVGDYMDVTAPSGEKLQVTLDPFLSSKKQAESKSLQEFIRRNSAAVPNLANLEKEYTAANKRFTTQKEVDDSITQYNQEENAYRVKSQELLKRWNELEAERLDMENAPQAIKNTVEFKKRAAAYDENANQFSKDYTEAEANREKTKEKADQLNAAIGKYTTMKAEQGSWLGGLWNKALTGAARVSSAAANAMTDLLVEVGPKEMLMTREEYKGRVIDKAKSRGIKAPSFKSDAEYNAWYNSLNENVRDSIDNEIEDEVKKTVKYGKKDELTGERKDGMLEAIRKGNRVLLGDKQTTPEWEDLKSKGFWGGAVLGLAESLPAMMGSTNAAGWAQRTAQMYGQISDNLNEEMSKNPDFENISESEKLLVTAPIGVASAALESIGFRNVIANKGLLNGIIVKALGKQAQD